MNTESVKTDVTSQSWFDNVWQKLGDWNISKGFLVELLVFLLCGFIIGFVLKNFGRHIILIIIGSIISIWLLEMFQIISINYSAIESIVGASPHATISELLSFLLTWVKEHIAQCVAAILGFYIALELA